MEDSRFGEWGGEKVEVPMTKLEILSLIGNIILALQHPNNVGPTSQIARGVGRRLADLIKGDDVIPPKVLAEWQKEGLIE